MDSTDKKLLQLLQADTKKTTKELSLKLNLSVTAVYERIKKLEREGIIDKYVALLNRNKIDKGFVVFCHIKLVQHSKDFLTKQTNLKDYALRLRSNTYRRTGLMARYDRW